MRLQDVSRESINQWQKAGKIIGVSGAKRGMRYPAWQIDARGKPYKAIGAILEALHGDHWAAWRFLSNMVSELGQIGYVLAVIRMYPGRIERPPIMLHILVGVVQRPLHPFQLNRAEFIH